MGTLKCEVIAAYIRHFITCGTYSFSTLEIPCLFLRSSCVPHGKEDSRYPLSPSPIGDKLRTDVMFFLGQDSFAHLLNHVGEFARPTWLLILLQRREMSRHLRIAAAAAVFLLFLLSLRLSLSLVSISRQKSRTCVDFAIWCAFLFITLTLLSSRMRAH